MIIYAHGFHDSLQSGEKQKGVYLKNEHCALTPDLPQLPSEAMSVLRSVIGRNLEKKPILVGHSLGGFYMTSLSQEFNLPAVLTNPVVYPYNSGVLAGLLHDQPELLREVRRQLKEIEQQLTHPDNILTLLQKADEAQNYHDAELYYSPCNIVVLNGGSHKFDDFQYFLPIISYFQKRHYGETS